jgi:hypothetical protein
MPSAKIGVITSGFEPDGKMGVITALTGLNSFSVFGSFHATSFLLGGPGQGAAFLLSISRGG